MGEDSIFSNSTSEVISISDDSIPLGKLLKLHGVAETGAMAKMLIATGEVQVNGETETARGRKIYPGMTVTVAGAVLTVVSQA